MITQRVAANFWEYGVPYYNPDEAVAANTSLFWPMILSPIYAIFSLQGAVLATIIGSAVLSALTLVTAARLTNPLPLKIALVALLALAQPFRTYGPSGWEHIPQMFLITVGLVWIAEASRMKDRLFIPTSAVIVIGLSFVFRPDSAPIIAIITALWFFSETRFRDIQTYVVLGGLLIIPVSYALGMQYFYDAFVPNTAQLKLIPFEEAVALGISYVTDLKKAWLFPVLLVLLALLPKKSPFTKLLLALCVFQTVYIIMVGGDYFQHGRFFLILLPVLVFTLADDIRGQFDRPGPLNLIRDYALVIVIAAATLAPLSRAEPSFANKGSILINEEVRIAKFLNCALRPDQGSVGLYYLGIGYHLPDFHIVDFLGKAEPNIAQSARKFGPVGHNKWDYDYAFATYDILALPVAEAIVNLTQREGYVLQERDFMYYEDVVLFLEERGGYRFVAPGDLGNRAIGVFLRDDLLDTQPVQSCLQ